MMAPKHLEGPVDVKDSQETLQLFTRLPVHRGGQDSTAALESAHVWQFSRHGVRGFLQPAELNHHLGRHQELP